jgi:hypothetical protein
LASYLDIPESEEPFTPARVLFPVIAKAESPAPIEDLNGNPQKMLFTILFSILTKKSVLVLLIQKSR